MTTCPRYIGFEMPLSFAGAAGGTGDITFGSDSQAQAIAWVRFADEHMAREIVDMQRRMRMGPDDVDWLPIVVPDR